jgi:epoxyqueuosine reductase QueG
LPVALVFRDLYGGIAVFQIEGADRAYAVSPAYLGEAQKDYPGATALVVLLRAWRPYRTVKNGKTATICAYYPAENALYHAAGKLCETLSAQGYFAKRLVGEKIPVRRILADAGIAAIGENGLAATKSLGSYFAVQLVITDALEPQAFEKEPAPCNHCKRCIAACPGKALPMTDPKKCIRWWMDGQGMPGWAMDGMRRLFGCELCQLACPRNAHLPPVQMPEELHGVLNYERLFLMDKAEKAELSALVGKNLLTRGRVQAQALVLAEKEGVPVEEHAKKLLSDERPAVRSAAKYIRSHASLTDAPQKR